MTTLKSWRHTMTKDIKEMAQAEDDLLNMEQTKQAEFIKNYKAMA